jgi:ABC-type branched-subunit amino acid transport system ATPase component
VPKHVTEDEFKKKVDSLLMNRFLWAEAKAIRYVKKKQKDLRKTKGASYVMTTEEIQNTLAEYLSQRRSRHLEFARAVTEHVRELVPSVTDEEIKMIMMRMEKAPNLKEFLKK